MLGRRRRIWIVLPGLIRFSPHDVLKSIFHLGDVVTSAVELLDADKVHTVDKELRFDLKIEG